MLEGNALPLLLIQTEDLVIHIQGTPGIAKTQVMQQIARLLRRNIYTLIGSIREPVDFYGFPHVVPMVEKEIEAIHGKVAGMNFDRSVAMVSPKWVLDTYTVNSNGGWIVFLDELTCNSAPVQNAMLRVLAEKYVGDTPLAPGTILVAASNPANIAVGGNSIEPALANRMGHFPWDTMTSGWVKGMLTGTRTFPLPDMIQLPADWKKHQPKADTMVAAFIQRAPSFHDQFPGNDREKAGGAFPSPRSWLMFATARAALISVGAEHSDVARCAMAFVGEAAAAAYAEWEKALDLPDPEELLRAAIDQKQGGKELTFVVPDRGDLVLMVLQSLGEAVAGRNTKERWEAAMDIAARIWDRWKEISIIGASRLAECYRKGYTMDSRFVKEALEVAAKAGIIKR